MAKLVIVESPAKAKTIKKYLGRGYDVIASMGHVRDLPKTKMGIDIEHNFEPQYINIKGKGKLINELKAAAKKADTVYRLLEWTKYTQYTLSFCLRDHTRLHYRMLTPSALI